MAGAASQVLQLLVASSTAFKSLLHGLLCCSVEAHNSASEAKPS